MKAWRSVPALGVTDTVDIDTVLVPVFFRVTDSKCTLNRRTVRNDRLLGVTLSLSGAALTVNERVVVCDSAPLVPVTATE